MELENILDGKNREDIRRELTSRWKFEFKRHNTVFSFPSQGYVTETRDYLIVKQ